MISRRSFLQLSSAVAGLSTLGVGGCSNGSTFPEGLLWSAANRFDGSFTLQSYDIAGGAALSTSLPVRAHGTVLRPGTREVLAVSRRPGTEFFVVDRNTGVLQVTVTSPPERHFLGHGVFDQSARYLYTTENSVDEASTPDITPRDSVIGIYDAEDGYRRVGELPTYGVGAHELIVCPVRNALIVANGGIYTHPSRPREKLNIDTMQPSLAYIDRGSGALLESHSLPDTQLGIRHLAAAPDGTTYFGCQHASPSQAGAALVYRHSPGQAVTALAGDTNLWSQFDSYIGSVAVHPQSGAVAATSPVGGVVGLWQQETPNTLTIVDGSGVAVAEDCFIVTTGIGELHIIDASTLQRRGVISAQEVRWDNHCTIQALSSAS